MSDLTFNTVFLTGAGKLRLAKQFFADGSSQSYPNASKVTSHLKTYNKTEKGFEARLKDMRDMASKGACMLKGELNKELKGESRAGHANKFKPNSSLILDIDNLPIDPEKIRGLKAAQEIDALASGGGKAPAFIDQTKGKIGPKALECIAEHIIHILPEELHNVSYFLHASSSMGRHGLTVASMHIEFILDDPVQPETQKKWLLTQNLINEEFAKHCQLSANGLTLKYPLDVSVYTNAKLIFIAHPYFQNTAENPIEHRHRILLIKKANLLLDSNVLKRTLLPEAIKGKQADLIKKLRKALGLPAKTAKTVSIRRGDGFFQMLRNPDEMEFDIVQDDGDFVHANINGGDSNGYWWFKNDPTLVYNFKDEPVFRMEDANPTFYAEVCRIYSEYINAKKGSRYLVRRVRGEGGAIHCFRIDGSNRLAEDIPAESRQAAEDWAIEYGEVMPDNIRYAQLVFNPQSFEPYEVEVDDEGIIRETINKYIYPDTLMKAATVEEYSKIKYGEMGDALRGICPNTYKLLAHVMNYDDAVIDHFLNWIICAARERIKIGTTWLLQGTQGTGKGLFWKHIATPIFGKPNIKKTSVEELEDKFDANLSEKLFILVDEFRHSDATASKKLERKLKLMATEEDYALRRMHAEYKEMNNHFNMLFFSNAFDAMRVEDGDRRTNIAPRQEISLRELLGKGNMLQGLVKISELVQAIEREQDRWVNFVMNVQYSLSHARDILENKARAEMRAASRTSMEDFAAALSTGRVEPLFYMVDECPPHMMELKRPAEDAMKRIATHYDAGQLVVAIPANEMGAVFSLMMGKVQTPHAATKWASRHSTITVRRAKATDGTDQKRVFEIQLKRNNDNDKVVAMMKARYGMGERP